MPKACLKCFMYNHICVCLVTQSWLQLATMDCSLPGFLCLWDFPDKNTGVGCHFLLQGIFLTLGSNPKVFATLWIAARQASLSITNSWSSLRLTSIESVMPSSHLILCRPLLLLPPIPPSTRVFSNESTLRMRWPKCHLHFLHWQADSYHCTTWEAHIIQ